MTTRAAGHDDEDEPLILLSIGGQAGAPAALPLHLPVGSVVVAADSGLDRLVDAALPVDHVVGDLDSVDPRLLIRAEEQGARVHRHPADKDATDIELALQLILHEVVPASGVTRLLVVGPGGGRLDHLVADLLVLTAPALRPLHVSARIGAATVTVVRPGRVRPVTGRPGEQVSLLPFHGPARGVTTQGLRWPLVDADLGPGTTRAVSNELVGTAGAVRVDDGVLAVVQPGTVAPPIEARHTPYDPSPRTGGNP